MAPQRSRFLVWGAGGHGRVVADLVRACGHELVGFVDADPAKREQVVEPGGARVVLHEQELIDRVASSGGYPDGIDALALAIGDNQARLRGLATLRGLCAPALVHPSAVVSPSASIGRGAVVFPGAVLNAGARIGDAVIINSGAVVEHDCVVAEGVHVSPNATLAGGVRVGARSWVGAGATVIQSVVVGEDVVVGAGAVVIRDVPGGSYGGGRPGGALGSRVSGREHPIVFTTPPTGGGRPGAPRVRPGKRSARRRRRKRLATGLLMVGVLALGGWVAARTSLLYRLATWVIVVDDEPQPSDFIYVLNGAYSSRAPLAARLYLDGLAPRVVLPLTLETAPATATLPETSLSERIASAIRELGVPEGAVSVFPYRGGVVNTHDEALALRAYVDAQPTRRVIVVTTDYHTGRARRTIRKELRGTGVEVLMAAAPDDNGFSTWNWWESEAGRRVYMDELLKQAAVLFGVSG